MKPKVAFYWCASCGGCEEAVVDLERDFLAVADQVDIVLWPVALDFKQADIEALEDGAIAVSFINGAIRTSEQLEAARLLRRKSQIAIAFGACAQTGGIPGLANLSRVPDLLREVYGAAPPQTKYAYDGHTLALPELLPEVFPLDRAIPVEYYLPGCPPSTAILKNAFTAILTGSLPEPGSVLAPSHSMCEECPRRDSRPEDLTLKALRRVHEVAVDPQLCILAQGLPCLGSCTRAGCGARCIAGNMPCTGCFGPTGHARDFGAKALCSVASLIGSDDPAEIGRILDGLPDPVSTFNRYTLPSSFVTRRREEVIHGNDH